MKKFIVCILMVVIAVATVCVFVGCTDKNEETVPAITGITAKIASDANYKVGSAFDSQYITVTATLDNKTTKVVSTTAAISYDIDELVDDEGYFKEAGEFTIDVTYSDWTTQVTIKVNAA